ncbi:4-carboxymuconolactone decarboxylase [Streptomyces sp. RB6PN25]|uniref:4-carboxymuconolactone decarboxylase n=1 Tax=Streptomyces humicola TaxID=2953240 RepID=A0ABT1Q5P2_9ACTN|nr:4-carboxymuconolactone decarboxylase [Streptomyces humicola]MCQ4084655.1 4-carboxymuconolactone decarboxylase [Streptomyces humicola]
MTDPKTLQHRIEGPEGAPVLVLGPALGTTWHMWDRQIPELAAHWRVLRYDLPGHGGAPVDAASSVTDLADRLLATLDDLGVETFGYVGCQLGGAIGIDLALRHPDRVASLGLVSASARFETPDSWRQRGVVVRSGGLDRIAQTTPEQWFHPVFRAAQPSIVEWAVQMVRATEPDCYIAACEALAAFDVRTELARIAIPTLVVAGAEDPATPPGDARALVAGIPDGRLAVVPGAAHLVPVEQPRAVTDLIVRHFTTAWQDRPATAAINPPPVRLPVEPPAAAAQPPRQSAPEEAAWPADATEPPDQPPAARPDPYESGLKVRREVLGDAHVDRAVAAADDFTADFQEFITRYAWGEVWTRPGLDRRTRSCVTLTALAAGGHLKELAFHVRAALRNGLAPDEIKEVLIQTAVYCGIPAANSAFVVAQRVIKEETSLPG